MRESPPSQLVAVGFLGCRIAIESGGVGIGDEWRGRNRTCRVLKGTDFNIQVNDYSFVLNERSVIICKVLGEGPFSFQVLESVGMSGF